jgi:hypothetical protein
MHPLAHPTSVYNLALATYGIAAFHFTSEMFLFKTVKLNRASVGTFVTACECAVEDEMGELSHGSHELDVDDLAEGLLSRQITNKYLWDGTHVSSYEYNIIVLHPSLYTIPPDHTSQLGLVLAYPLPKHLGFLRWEIDGSETLRRVLYRVIHPVLPHQPQFHAQRSSEPQNNRKHLP